MKRKFTLLAISLSFFMVGFLTARSIYSDTDIPYFKLLLYLIFGIHFLNQYRKEIKQS